MSKVWFLPRYNKNGASSRYRIYNYLPYYLENGLEIEVSPLFGDWYLDCISQHKSKLLVTHKIIFAYIKRLFLLFFIKKDSLVYIGAELFPYLPFGFEYILIKRKIKYLLEFDDAIFHYYDESRSTLIRSFLGDKTEKAISYASFIITGSEYLTHYVQKFNKNVLEIPTSADRAKYDSSEFVSQVNDVFVIGWIGSISQSKQILSIIPALIELKKNIDYRLELIGFDVTLENHLAMVPHKIIKWSEQTEIFDMRRFNVGIMPLTDTPFNRGKCAFKLIQYMGVGIPTISAPLASNINVDNGSGNLFATSTKEWIAAFMEIYTNKERYIEVGQKNKEIFREKYTLQSNVSKYLSIINTLISQ